MRRWTARIFLLGALSIGVGGASLAVSSCKGGQDTLCEPGKEIFCKCRGGFEGTQTCLPDGNSFGECTTPEGSCPAINMSSSSGATSGASSGSGSTGDKLLYDACTDGSECASGICDGFCTLDCASYVECENKGGAVGGDCVRYEGGTKQRCAPYCANQEECTMYYAAPVACGGAKALDNPALSFAVCAPWSDSELDGMPVGTPCNDTDGTVTWFGNSAVQGKCGLGLAIGNICLFEKCGHACYEDADCPVAPCSSNGIAPGCCPAPAPQPCDVQ
ncbi:MAG: hypothetical protein U0414_18675 [Polyangiaceae bacterium]